MKACRLVRDERSVNDATEAMARYIAGDDEAFSELYGLVAPQLLRYLTRRTRDVELARDLVQQTMLIVHRARARYLRGADVVPWVLAIGRHLLIDHARKAKRTPVSTDDRQVLEVPSRAERADDLVAARELLSRIDAEVASLPEPQRRVFELLKRRGLSLSETAAALEITVGAVKLRIHRAHRSLRAALGR